MYIKIDVQFSFARELNDREIKRIKAGVTGVVQEIPELAVLSVEIEPY